MQHFSCADTLEKKVSKFLKKFGIRRAFCTDTFSYFPKTASITFTPLRYTSDKQLIEYLDDTFGVDSAPWFFVFSLLHEVGHHMTVGNLTAEDIANEDAMRNTLYQSEELGLITLDQLNESYFDLPAERMATEWAINYISDHPEECWEFQKKCRNTIIHLFKKNSFKYKWS